MEKVFEAGAMQELGGKRVEIKHATPKGAGSLGGRSGSSDRGGGSGGGSSGSSGGGGRGAGYGRAAAATSPVPFGQMPGAPFGFGMFPYPPGGCCDLLAVESLPPCSSPALAGGLCLCLSAWVSVCLSWGSLSCGVDAAVRPLHLCVLLACLRRSLAPS